MNIDKINSRMQLLAEHSEHLSKDTLNQILKGYLAAAITTEEERLIEDYNSIHGYSLDDFEDDAEDFDGNVAYSNKPTYGGDQDKQFYEEDFDENSKIQAYLDIKRFIGFAGISNISKAIEAEDPRSVGMDIWLSRQRLGSGFFERDYPEAKQLEQAAQQLKEVDLELGEDMMLHFSNTNLHESKFKHPLDLIESLIGEDYPEIFNMEEFKLINDVQDRYEYAIDHGLYPIGSGTGRAVYKIDDEKVLKIAKNPKGIAQNQAETIASEDIDINEIFAKIFEKHPKHLWHEMELARKLQQHVWEAIMKVPFDDFNVTLGDFHSRVVRPQSEIKYTKELSRISEETLQTIYDSSLFKGLTNYMQKYNVPVGDLTQLDSYGLVKRDGNYTIVLIDYGLTWEIYDEYYK